MTTTPGLFKPVMGIKCGPMLDEDTFPAPSKVSHKGLWTNSRHSINAEDEADVQAMLRLHS